MTTIAIIADIHGNAWALDAVLADIARRGITQIVNLGDSVWGSLDPRGTAERLMRAGIPSICGNEDRTVFAPSDAVRRSVDYAFVTGAMTCEQIDWMRVQPKTLVVGDVFCCHGTPQDDLTYLLESVTPQGVFLRPTDEIADLVRDVSQSVIVCGHSHVARTVWLPNGQLIVNPGSVGIPAYDHDEPCLHVMEAGSPHARYAILSKRSEGWDVEHVALHYPWHLAAEAARARGRPDRAAWIETGRATL